MNFFKKGVLSIIRKPSKSLLLFMIVFLLGNLVCGSQAIMQATVSVKNDIKQQLGALITIHANSEMNEDLVDYITFGDNKIDSKLLKVVDVFEEVSNRDEVQYSDYMYRYNEYESREIFNPAYDNISVVEDIDPLTNLSIMGVSQSYFGDIKYGRISIVEGRSFSEEEIASQKKVIILNEAFKGVNDTCEYVSYEYLEEYGESYYICNRDKRDLEIGDKVTLVRQLRSTNDDLWMGFGNYDVYYEDQVEYEIIGFYKELTEYRDNSFSPSYIDINGSPAMSYTSLMDGDAYIPVSSMMEDINEFQIYDDQYRSENSEILKTNNLSLSSLSIELNDPEMLDEFMKSVESLFSRNGLYNLEYYTSRDTYNLVAGPIESLSTISNIVLIVSVIASIIILTLVIVLFLKDRKHEIGIYVSLGEVKWKMITQIVLEVFVVAIIAVSLSLLSGIKLGKVISDEVLKSAMIKEEEVVDSQLEKIGSVNRENLQMEDVTSQVTFTMDANYIISVYGTSLIVIVLSSAIPIMYILRMDPKKILM